jgi:protein transport protein SEC31
VLSVAWCHLDHNLLLSCGKDNRTILWNPQVPKILGEFPIASTWAFETQWCPQNPDILANATFEGKIIVHRLQSTMPKQEVNGAQPGAGEDFFSQRQYVSEGGFELKQAPKWLQVPCSASFGFGGSLVSVNNSKGKKEVKLSKYISEPEISENASQFEEAIRTADWIAYCEKKIDKASTDGERGNWELLRILFNNEPRKKLIKYLGIRESEVDGLLADKVDAVQLEKTESEDTVAPETVPVPAPKNDNRLSGIFGDKTDDFLSQISPTSELRPHSTGLFSILSSKDSESDKAITQAILFGHFDQAVGICLKEDRLADAFVLATLGDQTLQKKVQDAYFSRNVHRASYLRLLQSVIDSNLRDVAQSAELLGWKQILAVFCTFAKSDDEFAGLCDTLGQRLEGENKVEDAKVCYLAGKKLDRVVSIWISEAETQEKSELKSDTNDSAFSIHARALQGFVEKVTVFKQTKGTMGGDLKPLYDKYTEFVEIVASQGNLLVAQKYIDLLPGENDTVKTVKTRLSKAMAKAPVAPTTPARAAPRAPGSAARGGIPPATITSPYPQAQPNLFPQQYSSVAPAPASFPAPSAAVPPATGSNPYAPRAGSTQQYTPAQPFNPYNPGFQSTNPTLSRVTDLPPPPPKKSNENWNDPPMLPNLVRTRTPAAPLVKPPSPFPGQSPAPSPVLQKPPPGPPPMSAKPPQRMKSPPISSPTISQGQFHPQRQVFSPTPPMTQPPPSRPPQSTFTPPPGRSPQAPPPAGPPTGQYRPQSTPGQSRPQYAPSPIQQQPNSFPAPPSAPPGRGGPYTPQTVQTPSAVAPPAKPTPPPAKFRTFPFHSV